MNSNALCILATISILAQGCQATSLARKEAHLRDRVNDLYVDQAMDNLVRARTHRPFMLMDYRDFQFQGTDTIAGAAAFDYEVASAIRRVFHLDGGAERKELMSFKSDPVTTRNATYDEYMAFAFTPGLLNVSAEAPEHCYLCREYCGHYYWIPCDAAPVFMSLVMDGSMLLGPQSAPPAAYDRKIVSVERLAELPLGDEGDDGSQQVTAKITLESEVPAGSGMMVVKLADGRTVSFRYTKLAVQSPRDGELVKEFQGTWDRRAEGFGIHDLQGTRAWVYSDLFPPEAPSIDSSQRIIDELRDIQSLQFMEGGLLP